MKVQCKFKMQAHIISGVVMDIAAFKVSHSAGIDKDATALRAARARSSSIHGGDGTLHMGSIRRKAHPLPQNAHSIGQYSSGAMEDMSGKVQNESTHILRRQNHEHAHSIHSVQGPVQWGDGGNVWEGSKCKHSAP